MIDSDIKHWIIVGKTGTDIKELTKEITAAGFTVLQTFERFVIFSGTCTDVQAEKIRSLANVEEVSLNKERNAISS